MNLNMRRSGARARRFLATVIATAPASVTLVAGTSLLGSGIHGLPALTVPVAHASSVDFGSDGNCNSWVPHGWSWTDWSGYSSGDWGKVQGNLQIYDVSTGSWFTAQTSSQLENGPSGSTDSDNYYGSNEKGSGKWQQYAWHSGSIFNGTQTSEKAIWCGAY